MDKINVKEVKSEIDNVELCGIHFFMSQNWTVYRRTYTKIYKVLSNIGGIIKFFMLLGKMFVNLFGKKFLEIDLVNSFYHFNNHMSSPNKKNLSFQSNIDSILSKSPINTRKIFTTRILNLTNSYKKIKDKQKIYYKLDEIFCSFICPKSILSQNLKIKETIIKDAYTIVKSQLDYATVFKKFQEVKIIKNFLFNEKQLKLFYFLPQPIEIIEMTYPTNEDLIDVFNYYSTHFAQSDIIDQKLIQFIDKNLLDLFDKLIYN